MSQLILLLVAPLLVGSLFFELNHSISGVGLIVIGLLALLTSTKRTTSVYISSAVSVLLGLLFLANQEYLLRFYPAIANGAVACLFLVSLIFPPCVVLRIARTMEPDLPPEGVQYCVRVNVFWGVFMTVLMLVSLYTVFYGSDKIWAIYNGLVNYLLIGFVMVCEFFLRRRVKQKYESKY